MASTEKLSPIHCLGNLFVYPPIHSVIHLLIHLPTYPPISPSTYQSIYPSIHLSSIHPPIHPSIHSSVLHPSTLPSILHPSKHTYISPSIHPPVYSLLHYAISPSFNAVNRRLPPHLTAESEMDNKVVLDWLHAPIFNISLFHPSALDLISLMLALKYPFPFFPSLDYSNKRF